MKKYIRASLDIQYRDIFKELNLSPEKLEKFKDLLVDRATGISQLSPEIMSASTKEQKADLQQRYSAILAESETKAKELLGNADYQTFQEYYERSNSRYFINSFKESLDSNDQLTKDQEKALINIMYKEEQNVYSGMGYNPNKTIEFPSDVKEGKVDGQLKNMEKIHLKTVENAKGVLSDSQLEQLKNYLKSRREMMELSSKLSNQ